MRPSPCATRSRAGSALVAALVALVVLVSTGTTLLTLTIFRQSVARSAKDRDLAVVVAEAGIELAVHELQSSIDLDGDGLGNCTFETRVGRVEVVLDPPYAGPGQYVARASAEVNGLRRGVGAILVEDSPYQGFFGVRAVSMRGGAYCDSYDSRLGSYASQVSGDHAGEDAWVGSNGDVEMTNGTELWGDAVPGPTGIVTGDSSLVSGSIAPAHAERSVDPYLYSPALPAEPQLTSARTFTAGSYRTDSIDLDSGDELVFEGEVVLWVDGPIRVGNTSAMRLAPGATLTLHHGSGTLDLGGGGAINSDGDPGRLEIFSASTDIVRLRGTADFHGVLFAPAAPIDLAGTADIYGSAVGDTIELTGSSALHYDVALRDRGGARFRVDLRWPL